uniref:Uncharacterized protein n=1 Tax=Romanomermis culicivorax TaxID=13658 RepID=A0A915J7L2_ROMCU
MDKNFEKILEKGMAHNKSSTIVGAGCLAASACHFKRDKALAASNSTTKQCKSRSVHITSFTRLISIKRTEQSCPRPQTRNADDESSGVDESNLNL